MSSAGVTRPHRRPWIAWLISGVAVLVAIVAVIWASLVVLTPPRSEEAPTFATASVERGVVEESLALNVSATRASTVVANNRAAGVVTASPGAESWVVRQGDVLFDVNERPVVAAAGSVPAYRSLGEEDHGRDVAQLEAMLASVGYSPGVVDGVFDASTTAAVEAWQASLGIDATGRIEDGDLVFVDGLPRRLIVDVKLARVGAELAGGEPIVRKVRSSARFSLVVTQAQARDIPLGAKVTIRSSGDRWRARTGRPKVDGDSVDIPLMSEHGSICKRSCDRLPIDREVLLPAEVTVVPRTSGLVVPAASILMHENQVVVQSASGQYRAVTVLASANGVAVIEGDVSAGDSVRIPSTVSP